MFRELIKKSTLLVQCLKIFIPKHPYLSAANITSLVLALFFATFCFIDFEPENKIYGFIFFIPFILTYTTSFMTYFIFKKIKLLSRVLAFCLNIFIISLVQIIIGIFFLSAIAGEDLNIKCNKIENYKLAISYMPTKNVSHFPDKIPEEASNIEYHAEITSFFGSQSLYLKFDTNSDFINNEIKKHKYILITPYNERTKYGFYNFYINNVDLSKFTLYIINDRAHENLPEHHFPYHYGIAVNAQDNQIMYYYENPD